MKWEEHKQALYELQLGAEGGSTRIGAEGAVIAAAVLHLGELVPHEPKQPCFEGDCIRVRDSGELVLVVTDPYRTGQQWVFRGVGASGRGETCSWHDDSDAWELAVPGPNHPRKDC